MSSGFQKAIHRSKVYIYLILIAATLLFAYLSYVYFEKELEARAIPQIERAATQVSKLLPQLEKNEQAVREVYDNLEKKRQLIYRGNEAALEKGQEIGASAETIISDTFFWMDRVTKLRVGREGHVIVISKDNHRILAHPDKQFLGEVLTPSSKIDLDTVPDISQIGNETISLEKIYLFFPSSIIKKGISYRYLDETMNAGIYGTLFSYKDTYIICGVTLHETVMFVIARCFFTTLFFFTVAWVLTRYIGFSLLWQKEEYNEYKTKIISYSCFALMILLAILWYYATILDLTGDITTMKQHARVAVETLNTYREYQNELSQWLDDQYLEQCYLAEGLVADRGKENLTRKELAKFAKELGVEYIYVFDKDGNVIVTNSPYDHFKISDNEEDQSYMFHQLLDGRRYLIQDPQENEYGEKLQYIGVSLRNEEDLADGFVQIAVDPGLRERLMAPFNVQTVLDNLVIGLPDYALAVDKNTKQIIATTGFGYAKTNIEDLGIDLENLKKDFSRSFLIDGNVCYAAVSESDDLYLIPIARSTDNTSALLIALKLTLFSALTFFLFAILALSCYKRSLELKALEAESSDGEKSGKSRKNNTKKNKKQGLFSNLIGEIRNGTKHNFEARWNSQNVLPVEKQTPEMRTRHIVFNILLSYSILLILFEMSLIYAGTTNERLEGFSYVILGNWESGVNIFSFSFCLFLACVLYVFQKLLNQVLYRIAKVANIRNETILLLLRDALKYCCALIFLYVGLAKFGIDTRALWASAGVLSLMVGFGAKDLISDVIAGLFIIFEGTYKIGDYITVDDWLGTVEKIGIRYTKISYYSDSKIINNSAVRDIVIYDGEEILKIPIPYETDLREIEKLFERELPLMEEKIPGLIKAPRYQGVNSFDESCVTIRISLLCKPDMRLEAAREAKRQIKLLFDREKINIPYNHLVVKEYKEEENTYTFIPHEDGEL